MLLKAVNELASGLHDGDLGKHLFKKRVKRVGRGKSGSYRVIIAIKQGSLLFFMFGYAKNEKSTLTPSEDQALKTYAQMLLGLTERQLTQAVKHGELIEVRV